MKLLSSLQCFQFKGLIPQHMFIITYATEAVTNDMNSVVHPW